MRPRVHLVALFVAGLLAAPLRADDALTYDVRGVLLLKVLAYDRNLKARAGDAVNLALVERQGDAASHADCEGFAAALVPLASRVNVAGMPVRVTRLVFTDGAALRERITAGRVNVIYACAGLGKVLAELAGVARELRVTTMSAQEAYVKAALGIGLVSRDNKPQVVVNLPVARAEGADLDSLLLRVSEVIR